MKKERAGPVTLEVSIEAGALKQVVQEGRLMEFSDALCAQVAGHIKGQIIEQLAKAATGRTEIGGAVSIAAGFDIDWPYGMGPKPWPRGSYIAIDTVPLPERELRNIVREELERVRK